MPTFSPDVPFDFNAFPEVDAAIATSPYTLKAGWLKGTDAAILQRIAPVRWDPSRDGEVVAQHLGAVIDADRPVVLRAMLGQGVPVDLKCPVGLGKRTASALRAALEGGSAATIEVLLEHLAQLTAQETTDRAPTLWLLDQTARRGETDPQRAMREREALDLLVAHGQAHRPDPALVGQAVACGIAADTLERLIGHGLATLGETTAGPNDGAALLDRALGAGHPRLVERLLRLGARPHPEAMVHPLVTALTHSRRPRDTPARRQYRTMQMVEALAGRGLTADLPADLPPVPGALPSSVPPVVAWSTLTPGTAVPSPLSAQLHGVRPEDLRPVLRLHAAGVFPGTWWAALEMLDEPLVTRALEINDGLCAHWTDVRNRNALHGVLSALGPLAPFIGALDDGPDDPVTLNGKDKAPAGPAAGIPEESTRRDTVACRIARRLLAQGILPLTVASATEPGALWGALDLPSPALATALLDALDAPARAGLLVEAVSQRRSARALRRLVAHGVPLDAPVGPEGGTVLHQAVSLPWTHDRIPLLLALGASVNLADQNGRTPQEVAEALRRKHADSPQEAMVQAVVVQLETVDLRRTLAQGPTPDAAPATPSSPSAPSSPPRPRL